MTGSSERSREFGDGAGTPRGLRRAAQWVRRAWRGARDADALAAATPSPAEFERVKASWEALGAHDPLWAIVGAPGKQGNRWDRDEFFATGDIDVQHVMNALRALELPVAGERALDFGSGVGRLTQALATRFQYVDGVDISASMITQAIAFNRHGDRVRYFLGHADRLPFAEANYDFILSKIVLQHVGIDLQRGYVREFIRVAKPGGVVAFQTPSRALGTDTTHFRSQVETPAGTATIDMNTFPRDDVERTIHDAGGRLIAALPDVSAGDAFESLLYVVMR